MEENNSSQNVPEIKEKTTEAEAPDSAEPVRNLSYKNRLAENCKDKKFGIMVFCILLISLLAANTFYSTGFTGIIIPTTVTFLYLLFYSTVGFGKELFKKDSIIMLVMIFILSLGFLTNEDSITNMVTILTLAAAIPIQLSVSVRNNKLDSFEIISKAVKMVFLQGVSAVPVPLRALFATKKDKKQFSKLVYICAGIACAIPFFIILTALFASGDDMFTGNIRIFLNCFEDVNAGSLLFTLFFGVGLTVILSGVFTSLAYGEDEKADSHRSFAKLNASAVNAFLSVLIALELFFSFIQVKYLFLKHGTLAEGESFADYARSGFFAISAATLLTIAIIIAVSVFTQRDEQGKIALSVRILLTVFSICVCMMFASSYYRMILYIDAYSLTVKRVAVCWLMALMLILLAGIISKLWLGKLNLMKYVTYTVMASVIVLNILGVQTLVAKNNVDRYIKDPKNYNMDFCYLTNLGGASIPQLERLQQAGLWDFKHDSETALFAASYKNELKLQDIRSVTLVKIQARKALDNMDVPTVDKVNNYFFDYTHTIDNVTYSYDYNPAYGGEYIHTR